MKYHVTFYYLASGMEGHADRRDYGIVEAKSEKDAKCKVIGAQWPDADDATKSFVLSCLTAKPVASKAAPVGELREAFEASYAKCVDDGWTSVKHLGRKMFEAGAACQRQLYAEHEGPDYGDGPEFEGWAERSAQQPQSAEAVGEVIATSGFRQTAELYPAYCSKSAGHSLVGCKLYTTPQPQSAEAVGEVKLQHMAIAEDGCLRWMTGRKIDNCYLYAMPDFGRAPKLYTTPQPSAGVVMPPLMPLEPFTTIDRGSKNFKAGWNAYAQEFARLNGKEVGRG